MTAIELITSALRLGNIIDENQTPPAEMGTKALEVLNEMMGQWDRDGIRLGWVVVATLATTVPVDLQDLRAVRFNLAVELAGEYGVEPPPRVTKIAGETYAALSKAHAQSFEASLELLPTPAHRYGWGSIETG